MVFVPEETVVIAGVPFIEMDFFVIIFRKLSTQKTTKKLRSHQIYTKCKNIVISSISIFYTHPMQATDRLDRSISCCKYIVLPAGCASTSVVCCRCSPVAERSPFHPCRPEAFSGVRRRHAVTPLNTHDCRWNVHIERSS